MAHPCNVLFTIVALFTIINTAKCSSDFWRGLKETEYEFVTINWPTLHKRSVDGTIPLGLVALGKKILLNLKPADDIIVKPTTPIYNVYSSQGSALKVVKSKLIENVKITLYEDERNLASVAVKIAANGSRLIQSAIIGVHSIAIRPASKKMIYEMTTRNNTRYDINNNYIVYIQKGNVGRFLHPLEKKWYSRNAQYDRYSMYRREIPDILYPEILVIADYYLVKGYKDEIISYLLTFWNQVDLMYRSLEKPSYRLNIAGIVIPKDVAALSYLARSARSSYNSKKLSFEYALNQCQKWLWRNQKAFPIDSYDVAITMTTTRAEDNGEIGLALVRGACDYNIDFKYVSKIGLVLDDGSFSGVATATHELGHTLGAEHDEGYCSASSGYIMSPVLSFTQNRFKWSECSLRNFNYFNRWVPHAHCIFNKPQ